MRRRQIASEIRTVARDWAANAEDEDDPSMVRMYRSDAEDLRKVAQLVDEGDIQGARDAASLDTQVREQLPQSFFDLLERCEVAW
jgi:ketosteroid isomerase-like protein